MAVPQYSKSVRFSKSYLFLTVCVYSLQKSEQRNGTRLQPPMGTRLIAGDYSCGCFGSRTAHRTSLPNRAVSATKRADGHDPRWAFYTCQPPPGLHPHFGRVPLCRAPLLTGGRSDFDWHDIPTSQHASPALSRSFQTITPRVR